MQMIPRELERFGELYSMRCDRQIDLDLRHD